MRLAIRIATLLAAGGGNSKTTPPGQDKPGGGNGNGNAGGNGKSDSAHGKDPKQDSPQNALAQDPGYRTYLEIPN
ncbi:MAG: hypothetical protein M1602_04765 [Firmicutes bacterium]|nr:hypothetical protein [Bacillota bacterium]